MKMNFNYIVGGIALLLPPLAAFALTADKNQPVNVEADSVQIDDKKGVSIYKGNVVITQGSLRLDADTVTIYNPNKGLDKIVAEGGPAHFKQRPDNKDEDTRAQAARIEYHAADEKILLLNNAHIWQDKNEFSGDKIEYDTKQNLVSASKSATGSGRVQVTIQPKTTEPAPAASTPQPDPH